jgi:hypothetical protein
MSYECDNDNHDIGCQCPGVAPSTIQQIRAVVARTIYTTPSEALKGMAEILHLIDG